MSGANMVVSWTLPPLSSTTRTRPEPSVRAWTLVVRPPRDRPIAWSPGSATGGCGPKFLSFDRAPRVLRCRPGHLLTGGRGSGVAADSPRACPVLVHPHHRGVRRDQPVQLPGRVGVGLGAGQQSRPGAIGAPAG